MMHMDFDEGDGSLYEFDDTGNPIALFTADPECPLETFEEFAKKAAFIVKAVNCHDELVAALRSCVDSIAGYELEKGASSEEIVARYPIEKATKALAKAKGDQSCK